MTEPIFTSDHHGFYRHGEPFFDDSSNTVLLRLPAQLSDTLDWSTQIEQATQIISSGKYILWEIDLGLSHFSPNDSAAFFSYTLALEEFTAKIWPHFRDHTFGTVIYRGNPQNQFPIELWENAFNDWSANIPHPCYTLFSFQMLSEYLHRLISFLPDALLLFAFINTVASPAKAAQLLSKARFEHLILKNDIPLTPSSTAIYLPDDSLIDPTFLQKLDDLLPKLTSFRIIPEEKLTEQWDGLDLLLVDPDKISIQGKRKFLGFIAAGGTVETFDGMSIVF